MNIKIETVPNSPHKNADMIKENKSKYQEKRILYESKINYNFTIYIYFLYKDILGTRKKTNAHWARLNRYYMLKWEGLHDEVERIDRILGGRNFVDECYRNYVPTEK